MAQIHGIQYTIKKCKDYILLSIPAFDILNMRIEDTEFKATDVLNYI